MNHLYEMQVDSVQFQPENNTSHISKIIDIENSHSMQQ